MPNKKLTMEWINHYAESTPNLVEILAESFRVSPHDFLILVADGKILYRTAMYKILQMWICAFVWQVVLRKPVKNR